MAVPATAVLSESLFVQNYGPALWGHTWSLAVEEHFYLLLTLGLWILSRRAGPPSQKLLPLPGIVGLFAMLVLLARVATNLLLTNSLKTHHFATHLRVDSLLFGTLLAYLFHFRPELFRRLFVDWRPLVVPLSVLLVLPIFF
jgi:peptidoglycan/LPS O-acetylase OafA/YrhL